MSRSDGKGNTNTFPSLITFITKRLNPLRSAHLERLLGGFVRIRSLDQMSWAAKGSMEKRHIQESVNLRVLVSETWTSSPAARPSAMAKKNN